MNELMDQLGQDLRSAANKQLQQSPASKTLDVLDEQSIFQHRCSSYLSVRLGMGTHRCVSFMFAPVGV